MPRKKGSGLRRRWLCNTVGILLALGMVCVFAVTASFAAYFYADLRTEIYSRAKTATEYLIGLESLDTDDYTQLCAAYAQASEKNAPELQFVSPSGTLLASSSGVGVGKTVETSDIENALTTGGIQPYIGKDGVLGERVMALSSPILDSRGETVGVLRLATSTRQTDWKIATVALIGLGALLVIVGVMWLSSNYYILSILTPLEDITEKARRIAGGSYGTQIQTRYRDEIGDLAQTINEMSVKISQNEKMQAEFISQLSHELRTPLTVINGWSETLLADEHMDSDTRQGMKIISSEAKRLTEMVMDLLDFTRMQDGRMTLAVEMTDIRTEFEDTVFMYGSRLSQEGIRLEYMDTMEDIPEIPCDPQRMRQVFLNILDNAAKHGGEGKRIDASMTADEGSVLVRIRDYGPGIPEDELPLVKKKFYKGSSSVRGTGIGLAVCDEIVEMHGGTLTLENASGGGTLVTVRLPVSE